MKVCISAMYGQRVACTSPNLDHRSESSFKRATQRIVLPITGRHLTRGGRLFATDKRVEGFRWLLALSAGFGAGAKWHRITLLRKVGMDDPAFPGRRFGAYQVKPIL